jgi:hypothetical protein
MNIQDIRAFLESNKDQPEVQSFVGELSAVSADKVQGFLQTEEGKKVIQPELDRYHAKGLESWKKNNLQKLVDDKVKELNPDKSPVEIELENLKRDLEAKDKASQRLALKNTALAKVSEKNLSIDDKILDRFITDDEESTLANLEAFETFAKAQYQSGVESVYKNNGRDVPGGGGGGGESDSYGKKLAEAVKAQTPVDLETQKAGFFK